MAVDSEWRELQVTFASELDERVRQFGALLLRLEKGTSDDSERVTDLSALFREAHSLKGAARAVEAEDIERLVHALESALGAAQKYGARPDRKWFDAVYRAVDTLSPLYQALLQGVVSPALDYPGVIEGLGIAPNTELVVAENVPIEVPPATNPSANQLLVASETVRVAVDKLDTLLALAGELSVAQIRIRERLREMQELRQSFDEWRREWRGTRLFHTGLRRAAPASETFDHKWTQQLEGLLRLVERADQHAQTLFQQADATAAELTQDTAQLGLISRDLESEVMAVRLTPVASVFGPLERLVRDLAREQDKAVQLVVEGSATEIDRKILEQLRDPLMHMIRNAVDHGVESPTERRALGKPAIGRLRLAASHRGGLIAIEIEDDGSGLDPARIRETAVRKGFLTREQAEAADDHSIVDLIFRPGFSTRSAVTETSGRGVGMDVVRENVESLHGHIEVASTPGRGSSFTILIPLTLATTRAILVEQSGQIFGIPSSTIERTSRVREQQFVQIDGRRTIEVERRPIVAIALADVLQLRANGSPVPKPDDWQPFFIVRQADRRVALLVDRLFGEQEVMIKSLGWPLRRVPNVSGAALLGSGQLVIILNPSDLVETGGKLPRAGRHQFRPDPTEAASDSVEPIRKRLLVVDDSLTTRTLVRSILEAAGYDVVVAADGVDALTTLRTTPIDLVVSDVDMPRLDGFALTAEIRRDPKLLSIPIVLVTSLEAPEHRERGVAAGADAYIVKSGFDESHFLETIGRWV